MNRNTTSHSPMGLGEFLLSSALVALFIGVCFVLGISAWIFYQAIFVSVGALKVSGTSSYTMMSRDGARAGGLIASDTSRSIDRPPRGESDSIDLDPAYSLQPPCTE